MFTACELTHLHFAYDVKKLEDLYQELCKAKSALAYSTEKRKTYLQRSPSDSHNEVTCSCWCCCKNKYNAQFYQDLVVKLSDEFQKEKEKALKKPIGTAFITFKTYQMAKKVHDTFHKRPLALWTHKLPSSKKDKTLKSRKWEVQYAPEVDDIYWDALCDVKGALGYYLYNVKYVLVNIAVLLFLLFLSTPRKCFSI